MNPNQIKRKDILCTSHWTDWTLYIILHLKVGHLISSLLPEEKCHARPEFSSQRKKILPLCGCDCFPIRLFNGELFHREDAQQLSSVWISLSLSLSLCILIYLLMPFTHTNSCTHQHIRRCILNFKRHGGCSEYLIFQILFDHVLRRQPLNMSPDQIKWCTQKPL